MFGVMLKAADWVPWMKQRKRFRERIENVKTTWIVKLVLINKLRAERQVGGMQFQFLGAQWAYKEALKVLLMLVTQCCPFWQGVQRLWAGQAELTMLCYPSQSHFGGKCTVWVARESCPHFTLGLHFLKMSRGAWHSVCSFSSVLG